jgi:dienelactone hydrolase
MKKGCVFLALIVLATAGRLSGMDDPSETQGQRWLNSAPPTPIFPAPVNSAEWKKRRGEIRDQLLSLLGNLPPRPRQPEVRIVSRREQPDYRVEKLEFDNAAGAKVAGYLLLPKSGVGRRPAILYCHWHGGEYAIGKEEIFQRAHTPEEPGPALARRGFVVLAIDAYCFGERSGRGPGGPAEKGGSEEMTASKFNLWYGRSLWGMILRDDLMAVDYLASRPEVDPLRLGVTGISMGATRTWWLMALDERLQAGVGVACLTRYQDLIATESLSAHGIYYFVPGLLNHFDTEAILALIAPRPILLMTGDQDRGSPVAGIQKIESAVKPVYQVLGRDSQFQNRIFPGVGHVYTQEMWNSMLAWMELHLQQDAAGKNSADK